MGFVRIVGGLAIGAIAYGYSSLSAGKEIDNVKAHYALNETQIEFTKSCASAMSAHNKTFKAGATTRTGCGCIASELGTLGYAKTEADYDNYLAVTRTLIEYSETDGSTDMGAMFGELNQVSEKRGLNSIEALTMTNEIGESMSKCGNAKLPRMIASTPPQTNTSVERKQKGCEHLSDSAMQQMQEIADKRGTSVEKLCENVVS